MQTRKEIAKEDQQHSIKDTLRDEKHRHEGEPDPQISQSPGQSGKYPRHTGRDGNPK